MIAGRRRGGLVRTVGRTAVVAGTASAVAGGVNRRQSQRWAEKEQSAAAVQQAAYDEGAAAAAVAPPAPPAPAPPAPAPAAPAAGEDDKMSQLERLGALFQQGILTEAEFAAEKAKILAG